MDPSLTPERLHCCPVAWQALRTPDNVAVQCTQKTLTFMQLHQRLQCIGEQLTALNMQPGDRLVCIAENSLALVLLQLCCLRHGFIFCPLNPTFSAHEICQRITHLHSDFIWQADNSNSLMLDFNKHIPVAVTARTLAINPLAITNIIFTSGSSGAPKAVMHHFSNHYYSALGSQNVIPLLPGDINLLSLPIFHISGYATIMRTVLAGATLYINAQKIALSPLRNAKITHLSLVSPQLKILLQDAQFTHHYLSLKHLLLGGSHFSENDLQALRERGFTYHLSYGSTEMASQIATSTNDQILHCLPYRQVKVVNNELQLSGKTRFAGYFDAMQPALLLDEEQYFASGDLGTLSEGSRIEITGRKDRQFISGGENIQPEEIEKILLCSPQLSAAYVLPITDKHYGQRPIAFVTWRNGVQITELNTFISDKLIAFKRPLHYLILPEQQGLKVNIEDLQRRALAQLV